LQLAAIFDVDGVLVDSSEAHYQSWRRLGEEVGSGFPRDLFDRTFGMHNNQIIPMWLGSDADVEALARRKEELYRAAAPEAIRALPGAVELVRRLHAAGFKLAVASSGPRANVDLIVRLLGIADLFDALANGDEVTHGKPHPEVFLKAIAGVGVDAERCVVVEDAPQGVEAGHAAGAAVIAVTSSRAAADLDHADRVVDTLVGLGPDDFRALVKGLRYEVGVLTHVGKVRKNNEDAWLVRPLDRGAWLLAVADGLGGLPAGEVASALAVRTIAEQITRDPADDHGAFQKLQAALEDANRALIARMSEEIETAGMGTTMVCLLLRRSGGVYVYAGDSSLLVFRKGRTLLETRPQGVGHIVRSHLGGNGAVLDPAPVRFEEARLALEPGDVVVLCSDGLTDLVASPAIGRIVRDNYGAQAAAERLVDAALSAGGHDNVTVIVARVLPHDEATRTLS
jgi:beta-phosphoglucomutase